MTFDEWYRYHKFQPETHPTYYMRMAYTAGRADGYDDGLVDGKVFGFKEGRKAEAHKDDI